MEEYFSISDAAKIANMTSETLRHYDRIGLVKPSKKDEWTGYRYYTKLEIVRLSTIHALRCMDLSLQKIKEVLEYDDLEKIVTFLDQAEKKADEKIAELRYSKSKIQLAKTDYENKLHGRQDVREEFTKDIAKRVILLSETLEAPSLDNLWNYLSHFYAQIKGTMRDLFTFEDSAGIYTHKDRSRLFAICTRHTDIEGLITLPAGTYLCADCTDENRERVLSNLMKTARKNYDVEPEFVVQLIMVTGILQWNYQIQIYLKPKRIK